jgi:hypothetical protein
MNIIADAYDLTSVIEKVCKAYKTAGSYFVSFCFAALAEEVDRMNIFGYHLLDETTKKEVPDWLFTVLQAKAPIAHAKLLLMYHVREISLDPNDITSRTEHMLENSHSEFLQKCVRDRCSEYQIAGSKWFIDLAAPKVARGITFLYRGAGIDVVDLLMADVSCRNCAARLRTVLEKAVRHAQLQPAEVLDLCRDMPWV